MINLESPRSSARSSGRRHQVAEKVLRPISRKYDLAEHERPKELDMLAAMIDGMNDGGDIGGAGATGVRRRRADGDGGQPQRRATCRPSLSIMEMCWGDVGLLLAMPRQGLGNAAIASVADEEQLARFEGKWAAMAITEPEAGSDSAAIRTTAVLDGDDYVLNGEKIYVTAGERADLVVVWATLDRSQGRAAIKSFVVERANPGLKLDRLEHKLGIRASDTAAFRLEDCRVPKENLLGAPEIDAKSGFAGVMQTFDNTRPLVAAMAVGLTRACLERDPRGCSPRPASRSTRTARRRRSPPPPRALLALEADYEAARLLTLQAAWMADNGKPNSLQASMAKAKAGRAGADVALRCVELCGAAGYGEERAAGEVGARREDPRHLRGDPADPAADHRPAAAGQDVRRAAVGGS